MSKSHISTRRANNLRRQRVAVRSLEPFGIMRGDRAILEINTDDIQIGEVGYFELPCHYDAERTYKQFRLVCAVSSGCRNHWRAQGAELLDPDALCLRTVAHVCEWHHEARLIGRVVAVERDGLSVETTLPMRPPHTYDAPPPCPVKAEPSKERRGLSREVAKAIEAAGSDAGIDTHDKDTEAIIVLNETWKRAPHHDLGAGDQLAVREIQMSEVRAGDFVYLSFLTTCGAVAGRVERAASGGITVCLDHGRPHRYSRTEVRCFLILSVRRTTIIRRPHVDGRPEPTRANVAKIEQLRRRLENLGDDITDSTQRFKIERQIYDLEREATFNDWPEVINA